MRKVTLWKQISVIRTINKNVSEENFFVLAWRSNNLEPVTVVHVANQPTLRFLHSLFTRSPTQWSMCLQKLLFWKSPPYELKANAWYTVAVRLTKKSFKQVAFENPHHSLNGSFELLLLRFPQVSAVFLQKCKGSSCVCRAQRKKGSGVSFVYCSHGSFIHWSGNI